MYDITELDKNLNYLEILYMSLLSKASSINILCKYKKGDECNLYDTEINNLAFFRQSIDLIRFVSKNNNNKENHNAGNSYNFLSTSTLISINESTNNSIELKELLKDYNEHMEQLIEVLIEIFHQDKLEHDNVFQDIVLSLSKSTEVNEDIVSKKNQESISFINPYQYDKEKLSALYSTKAINSLKNI